MGAIYKRELNAYFASPLGYAYMAVYFLFSGIFFFFFTLGSGTANLANVFSAIAFVLMCILPLLTMRLFAEEKRQKTDQLLLTSPVTLSGLVAAKFLAAFTAFAGSCVILLVYGGVLSVIATVNWLVIIGNFVGLLALGGIFIAVGIFISSLTENQMIAAILAMLVNVLFFIGSLITSLVEVPVIADIMKALSVFDRYSEFTLGIFKFGTILFFVSCAVIFLFLTVRVLDSRRGG